MAQIATNDFGVNPNNPERWGKHEPTTPHHVKPGSHRPPLFSHTTGQHLKFPGRELESDPVTLAATISSRKLSEQQRIDAIKTAAQLQNPALLTVLAQASCDPLEHVRGAAFEALSTFALGYAPHVRQALKSMRVELGQELMRNKTGPCVAPVLTLIEALGQAEWEHFRHIKKGLYDVALEPTQTEDNRALAVRILSEREGRSMLDYFHSVAVSPSTSSVDHRKAAVCALGLVNSQNLESEAVNKLQSLIASDSFYLPSFGQDVYATRYVVGCAAVDALLAGCDVKRAKSPDGKLYLRVCSPERQQLDRMRQEAVISQLGHKDPKFRDHIAHALLDASYRGVDFIVPYLRWMQRAEGSARAFGSGLLRQLNDELVVPVLLEQMQAVGSEHAALLNDCSAGLISNVRAFSQGNFVTLRNLMCSPHLSVAEAATEVYCHLVDRFPLGLQACEHNIKRPNCSERLARHAIRALTTNPRYNIRLHDLERGDRLAPTARAVLHGSRRIHTDFEN